MSKARIIHELHDDFGVTLSEAEKAYDIVVEYIRFRNAIGDHPEDYEPSEYVLVKTSAQPEPEKYEYHYDHTDCIWYRPEARNRCPTTCAQYRDGWNDAMNYIFRDGKGYRPYRRDKQYGE